jgi:ABC-type nitrate/sulfonate/bicarbonate transport system permease component
MNADGHVVARSVGSATASSVPERPTESFYQRNEGVIVGGLSVAVVLVVWQAAWSTGRIDPLFFSGPSAIFARLWDGLFGSGDMLEHIAFSAQNFVTGFGLAALVAIPLGILLGWYRLPRLVLEPFSTGVLPSTVPCIIVGLRQGLAHGLIGVVVGEFFAGSKGIGYLVGQAGMSFKSDLLFACVLIVATAGIGVSALLQRIEGYFQSWRPAQS